MPQNPLSPGSSKLSASFTAHEISQASAIHILGSAAQERVDGLTMPQLLRANTLATSTVMEGSMGSGGYVEGMRDFHISGSEPRVWPGVISRRQVSSSEKDGLVRDGGKESKPSSLAGGQEGH